MGSFIGIKVLQKDLPYSEANKHGIELMLRVKKKLLDYTSIIRERAIRRLFIVFFNIVSKINFSSSRHAN